ncbi:MAG: DUF1990 domain-containing protein [Acidobacteria bacterium]|nr:DUF1990 domain-containing protein [Acidobacteriota bacterium]
MFLISKPNEQNIERFLESQKGESFSYAEVGASRAAAAPNNYNIDHNRVRLGTERAVFDRAREAVRSWKMFDLTWTHIYRKNTPIEVGETVAILIEHFGFWSLNAAQIVYVLEEMGEIEKYGFAYGTLTEHGERGEERFSVEYHKADETVWYDLYAFSQPNNFWAKVGYPFSRYLQKQFAAESKEAMRRAVGK